MKILVPTDFSDNAQNAIDFAKKIAEKNKASITLLFAFYAVYDFAAQATEILGKIEDDAHKELRAAVEKGGDDGLKMDYKIIQGSVATAVTSFAYREDYDLIVMGTQGASGIKKTLIGSNTGHVIKESKISVLAIPSNAKWINEKNITVALELKNESDRSFKNLFKITEKLNFPYEFIHIGGKLDFQKEIEFKGIQTFLNEKFPHLIMKFTIEESSEFNVGMEKYLKENPGCLLTMFYKQKTFFEYLFNKSNSLEMAYHTHVPLLVMK